MALADVAMSSVIKHKSHAHILDCDSWSFVTAIIILFTGSILTL
jgi:hypothetical protein